MDYSLQAVPHIYLPYRPTPKQLRFHTSRAKYRLFGGMVGGGKAELVTQPILTGRGWTVFGDLIPGDTVCGPDGLPTVIVMAHPVEELDAFSVRLWDGSSTVCSGEHLWVVLERSTPVRTLDLVVGMTLPAVQEPGGVGPESAAMPRRIVAITPVGKRPVRCITVDREDGMYLTGRGLIPTHNSWALRWECYAQCCAIPRWTALLLRRTAKELEDNHISKMRFEIPADLGTFNEQNGILTFFNGSTMRFGHLQTKKDLQIYQGGEYGVIAADEATNTLTFEEFTFLTSRNRNTNGKPNFILASNPGGPGHALFKALFHDRRPFMGWPSTGYDPADFDYIPASIHDNPALLASNPDYLRDLENLPPHQRAAYLEGSWDMVAGQYFDCWDMQRNVDFSPKVEAPPWCERNIGIDWGYSHNSAVEWGVTDERAETLTIYRELVAPRMTPEKLGESILLLTPAEERARIANIYLSHDAHEQRKEDFTIADQLGRVLAEGGLPWPQNARSSRVAGWMHMYEMLRSGQLRFHKSCANLISSITELQHDPENSDDCLKVDGDDAPDAVRYLIQNRWGKGDPPFEVKVSRAMQKLEEEHGKSQDMNHVYFRNLMAQAKVRGPGSDRAFSLDQGRFRAGGRARRVGPWRYGR